MQCGVCHTTYTVFRWSDGLCRCVVCFDIRPRSDHTEVRTTSCQFGKWVAHRDRQGIENTMAARPTIEPQLQREQAGPPTPALSGWDAGRRGWVALFQRRPLNTQHTWHCVRYTALMQGATPRVHCSPVHGRAAKCHERVTCDAVGLCEDEDIQQNTPHNKHLLRVADLSIGLFVIAS